MRRFFVIALGLMLAVIGASAGQDDSIEALIKKLASNTTKEREAATKALMSRPEATDALIVASKSADREVARRAALVLDHFEQQILKGITKAAKEGRVAQLIDLVLKVPEKKHEQFLHDTLRTFAKSLSDRHVEDGGMKIVPQGPMYFGGPVYDIKAPLITEATPGKFPCQPILRSENVDIDYKRLPKGKPGNGFASSGGLVVCSGNVVIKGGDACGFLILARGNVDVDTVGGAFIVVSCGNINWPQAPNGSLLIAQGDINVNDTVSNSTLLSGKKVSLNLNKGIARSTIVESVRSPVMGLIRWDSLEQTKQK